MVNDNYAFGLVNQKLSTEPSPSWKFVSLPTSELLLISSSFNFNGGSFFYINLSIIPESAGILISIEHSFP